MSAKAESLIAAIGGRSNIGNVEACITRLRIEVSDPTKVDEEALREAGRSAWSFRAPSCRWSSGRKPMP